jgi:pimeloyl-ACP methyl ester carboxylesterase
MELYQVSLEAHRYGATIYVMGLLADPAALRTGTLIDSVPSTTRTVRLDLRGVELIDPSAFVSVARALNRWRDAVRGRVTIEFPARSRRAGTHLRLVRPLNTAGIAIATVTTCPINTSVG